MSNEHQERQMTFPEFSGKMEKNTFYVPHSGSGKLNVRQRKFAYYYAFSGMMAKAAIKAGYSEKNASKIANEELKKTQVNEAVSYFQEKLKREGGLDSVQIVMELNKVAYAPEFKPVKLKALELLAKIVGLIKTTVEVQGKDGGPIDHRFGLDPSIQEMIRAVYRDQI